MERNRENIYLDEENGKLDFNSVLPWFSIIAVYGFLLEIVNSVYGSKKQFEFINT